MKSAIGTILLCSLFSFSSLLGQTGKISGTVKDAMTGEPLIAANVVVEGTTFETVLVESDARIALEGAFKGEAGMILICGTRSIAVGKSIGRDGFNAVTRHLDGRGKKTLPTELLVKRFNLKTQEEIITAVYRENFDVASVAPMVIGAAKAHDTVSERFLNKATFELAEHVRALLLKIEGALRTRQRIPLAFIGGVITADNVYSTILKHKITFSLPQISIIGPETPPPFGAVLLTIESVTKDTRA